MIIAIVFLGFMLVGIFANAIENAAFAKKAAKKLENLKNDPNVIHYENGIWTDFKGRELVSVDLKNPNRFKV
jgi:hypothetical protein